MTPNLTVSAPAASQVRSFHGLNLRLPIDLQRGCGSVLLPCGHT